MVCSKMLASKSHSFPAQFSIWLFFSFSWKCIIFQTNKEWQNRLLTQSQISFHFKTLAVFCDLCVNNVNISMKISLPPANHFKLVKKNSTKTQWTSQLLTERLTLSRMNLLRYGMYPWLETGPSSSSLKCSSRATGSCGILKTVHRLWDRTWNKSKLVSNAVLFRGKIWY